MSDTRTTAEKFAGAARKRLCRLACLLGRTPALESPVFIVGCGRSGTTILGDTLAAHGSVTYLNEYRQLWARAYPATDVWSERAKARGGRLALDESVCTPARNRKLAASFYCETTATGRPQLVEKLPINSFRLPFVDAVFPDALFVHLLRNGLEVARSIERMPDDALWYGHDDYKWKLLVEYAGAHEQYRDLPQFCDTTRRRGLLEWRMSVETAIDYLEGIPAERHFAVTYRELLDTPVDVIRRIEEFIGLAPSEAVHAFAEANLQRRSPVIEVTSLSDDEERLAGDLMRRLGYLRS
jgi:LPS sulfotransferase NodH